MSRRAEGVALVVAAVFTLQMGAGLAVTIFDDVGPGGAVFLRLTIAAAVLWAIWRPRAVRREDVRIAVVFGLVLGGMNWAIYSAMDRIPLGVAVTIEFLGPLGLAVALSRRALDLLWVVLAGGGILLLTQPFGASDLDAWGVVFALLAAGAWAAYIPLSARTGRVIPGGGGLAIAMVAGAALLVPAGLIQGGGDLLRPEVLGTAAAIALASSVIPYTLEMEALRRLPARVFGILMALEPCAAALAGLVVLGQSLGAAELLGIALVVIAGVGATAG